MGNFFVNLGKGFIRSAVNQVGRDGGKVISNNLYGNAHSTPIRNTGIWLTLEGQVQSWGRSCTSSDTLYVVKGGTIDKEDQIRGYISNDLSKPIPKYYYMALLFKKGKFPILGCHLLDGCLLAPV